MTKQVKETEAALAPVNNISNSKRTNLFMSVDTFDGATGKTIGERIVDLYHYGTRGWIATHLWWAMHNGHTVEINVASDERLAAYTAQGAEALAAKFNDAPTKVVAAAA